MKCMITLALVPLFAATLTACGSSGDDELMRRVAQADDAASRAEASAKRAEAVAARLGASSSNNTTEETPPPPPEPAAEEGATDDTQYGKGTAPVPIDG